MFIDLQHIQKQFGGHPVLHDANLLIRPGERIGLVGRNGSGKTTLLRLIVGTDTPDAGTIYRKQRLQIGYLAQLPSFVNHSGRDVLYTAFADLLHLRDELRELEHQMTTRPEAMERLLELYGKKQTQFEVDGGYVMDTAIDSMIEGLRLHAFVDRSFDTLSGGERTKIGLALALLQTPDLLILDEPTNHLDLEAMIWLESYLLDMTSTLLVVSHDRMFLDAVATRIVECEDGELISYNGNYTTFLDLKEKRLLDQFHAYTEQQKQIKKMRDTIRQLRQWANEGNPPNEKFYRRAKSMEKALERIERIKRPQLESVQPDLAFTADGRTGRDVFEARDVSVTFEHVLFHDVSLYVGYGERVAIVGPNGSGKSTLLKSLLGEITPNTGIVRRAEQAKIGYLSQQIDFDASHRVIEAFRQRIAVDEGRARGLLAQFLFYGASVFKPVAQLSGGEKMRLMLAILVHESINVLVLDEPTNHLDIESREALEDAIERFDGTVVTVSHDRYFLNRLFPITYWLDGTTTRYEGPIGYALEKRMQRLEPATPNTQSKVPIVKQTTPPSSSREEERRLDELEATLKRVEDTMQHTSDLDTLIALQAESEQLRHEIDCVLTRLLESMM